MQKFPKKKNMLVATDMTKRWLLEYKVSNDHVSTLTRYYIYLFINFFLVYLY